jgi:hypothetical protein
VRRFLSSGFVIRAPLTNLARAEQFVSGSDVAVLQAKRPKYNILATGCQWIFGEHGFSASQEKRASLEQIILFLHARNTRLPTPKSKAIGRRTG